MLTVERPEQPRERTFFDDLHEQAVDLAHRYWPEIFTPGRYDDTVKRIVIMHYENWIMQWYTKG